MTFEGHDLAESPWRGSSDEQAEQAFHFGVAKIFMGCFGTRRSVPMPSRWPFARAILRDLRAFVVNWE